MPDQKFQLDSGHAGILGWIAQTGEPLRVDDFARQAHNLPVAPPHDDDHPPASAIYAPLLSGGQVVGVISVSSRRRQAFSVQDLEALRLMAMPVASALAMQQVQARAESRIRHVSLLPRSGPPPDHTQAAVTIDARRGRPTQADPGP